jgi:uncharacterized protein
MIVLDRWLSGKRSKMALLLVAFLLVAFPTIAWTQGKVCWADSECQPLSKSGKAPAVTKPVSVTPTAKNRRMVSDKSSVRHVAEPHKAAIQVSVNDKKVMDLALNNANNMIEYYKARKENVLIEIVAFGPGLHMFREDTSPVKDRLASMVLANSNVTLVACANTQANQSRAEGKPVTLISEAKLTPSGVVRLMELKAEGYAYIRP